MKGRVVEGMWVVEGDGGAGGRVVEVTDPALTPPHPRSP